jgi:ABC-2 type transport system permease protein
MNAAGGLFSKKNRALLKELVKTDFKLRYQGSILGVIWSVLKPLLLFFVMYMVFVRFLKFTDGTPTFPIVLLLGISLWSFFSEATSMGMKSIVDRGDLLRKINLPKYIIVASTMISALIGLGINLVVVLIFAVFSGVDFPWLVLLVPLSIVQFILLSFGLSLILSTLYVKFRDISHIWDVLLQALFYATPIIYPLSMITNNYPNIANLLLMSPMAQIIQDIRHNLIAPDTVPTIWSLVSQWYLQIIPIIITVAVFVVGLIYFHKNSKKFAETV